MKGKSLNILQVGSGFPGWGGTELHLINLSEQLGKRGHRVTVIAQPGKFVEEEARKRNLRCLPITVNRQWDFHEAGDLRRLMSEEKFDVVHVHWSTDYVVAPLIAKQLGVPVIVMSRHSPYPLKSMAGRYLYDRILFDRIIALSESVRKTLLAQGLRADKVVTIHHGTDTEAFRQITKSPAEVRAEWGIPENAFLVGMVGRIAEEKGWRTFLQAIAQLTPSVEGKGHRPTWEGADGGAGVRAVLVGEGPELEQARAMVRDLGLQKRVTFAGFRQDVNNAINALDIHVLASTWEEPCAAVVQQAMALGKPVIGTDIGGTPEMVTWGETGLLVPPGDPEAMTTALADLYNDAAKREWMGEAGRKRVEKLFTLRRMTDRNEALYYEVLQSKRAGAKNPTEVAAR